jgi:cytochrome c6
MRRASFPIAALAVAGALAGCGGGGGEEGGDTAGPGGAGSVEQPKGDLIAGRDAFLIGTEPRCGNCHTLADAGTTAKVGPNLDQVKPTFEQVLAAMKAGPGAMPQFPDVSMEVKENIAAYVEVATHNGG